MGKVQVISLLCVLVLVGICSAHIRLVHPVPRNQDTGIKGPYPCGPDAFWGAGQATTIVKPGVVTIKWEESINHIGAPFRIALSPGDDASYDKYILAAHIPHNDFWSTNYSFTMPKPYTLDVTIPDINCPKCSLQVLEIMTDKLSGQKATCCTYPDVPKGKEIANGTILCFSVYHTCANINIPGSIPVDKYVHTYKGPCGPFSAKQAAPWKQESTGDFALVDPNYAPGLKNTCPGWDRSACVF